MTPGEALTVIGESVAIFAALVAVIWQGRKTSAEVEQIKADLRPDSGKTTRDLLDRIERRQLEHGRSIGGIRDDARQDRASLIALQQTADISHRLIADRIDRLEKERPCPPDNG